MNDNGNNKGAAAERLDIHNSEIPEVCAACEARHGGICAALDPQQLLALSKSSSRHRITSGSELVGHRLATDEEVGYMQVREVEAEIAESVRRC